MSFSATVPGRVACINQGQSFTRDIPEPAPTREGDIGSPTLS